MPHYDPAIAVPFRAITPEMAAAGEAQLWRAYDALRCPTLLLRGAESDLLTHATALGDDQRGPRAELREFAGVGHAPMLVQPEQVGGGPRVPAARLMRAMKTGAPVLPERRIRSPDRGDRRADRRSPARTRPASCSAPAPSPSRC